MDQISTNWGRRAIVKKEEDLIDIKPNLNNTGECQRRANAILVNINGSVLSLETNKLFMELLLAMC